MFNGREPDERRYDFDFAALDSVAGRLWFLPTPSLALQVSAGHLNEAEPSHVGGPPVDVGPLHDVSHVSSSIRHRSFLGDDPRMGRQPRSWAKPRMGSSRNQRSAFREGTHGSGALK